MKKVKVVSITALFPQLPGGRCHQRGKGQGSSVHIAARNAMRNLLKQQGLKGQRYTEFSATFAVGTVEVDDGTGETTVEAKAE